MNLLQKAFSYINPFQKDANKLYQAIYSYFNGRFWTYITNKETFVRQGYQENIDAYSLIKLIAGKCANAKFYAAVMDAKGETKPQSKDSYLNKILKRPNEMTRQAQFIEECVSWLLITGDLYLYKVNYISGQNKGKINKLYTLPAQYVQIIGGGVMEPVSGYRIVLGSQEVTFLPEEIIHIKYFNPNYDVSGTQLYGQSPLLAALKTIQSSNEGTNAKIKAFINGGVAGLLSSGDANAPLAPEQIDHVNEMLRQKVLGSNNAHKISATSGIVNYTKIGESPADLEILKSLQFDSNQLCKVFGVDSVLFDNSASSYNNKKEAKKSLINDVVIPLLNLLVDGLDESFSDEDGIIEYTVAHFPELQEDMKEQVMALKDAYWMTLNEKRIIMKQEPYVDEMADKLFIPNNLTPLDEVSVSMDAELNNIDYDRGED